MHSRQSKYWIILLGCLILLSSVKLTGVILDKKAEQASLSLYAHDQNGVIEGLQSISILQEKKRAILFVHGFLDTPELFLDLVHDIKNKVNSDIYVPLLPFHGRDLTAASQFNNQVILNNLDLKISALAKEYESLTVVGMSYGGTLLSTLINENKIPDNVQLILYAPAFFITTNTHFVRSEARVYEWWRKYCNYQTLGCIYPGYQNGDATAKPMFDTEKSLRYTVIPALLQLYKLDLDERKGFANIHRPYSLIIAVDDNRVSYADQKAACEANQPYCHLYSFSSGKHVIHWGANKQPFEKLLIKLVNAKQIQDKPNDQ